MSHIQIGLSAIRAAQVALNTSAQNVANASTDGYHRQRVDLVDRRTFQTAHSTVSGGGVDVAQITRLRDAAIEQSLTSNLSGREAANVQLTAFQQIEKALTPGAGSIHTLVTEFFDQVEQGQATVVIRPGYLDDQTKVGFDHALARRHLALLGQA